jgi:23S rRNA pseudouridine1911/1915/1917 synthase
LLIAAKNDRAHQGLSVQWASNEIKRIYHTLCFFNIKEDAFIIDKSIGRHPVHRKKMAAFTGETHGKTRQALTKVKVLKRFKQFTLAEAQLETGRTHQIRVHLSSIGNPVVGDTVYGPAKQPFNVKGQMLHAANLQFLHPTTNKTMQLEAGYPLYFKKITDALSCFNA